MTVVIVVGIVSGVFISFFQSQKLFLKQVCVHECNCDVWKLEHNASHRGDARLQAPGRSQHELRMVERKYSESGDVDTRNCE